MSWRRLVQAYQLGETTGYHVARLRHQIFSQRTAGICESMPMSWTCGVQQQPWRLNGVARHDDRPRTLEMLVPVAVVIDHAIHAVIVAQADARCHGMSAYLGAVGDCVGNVRNQRARFSA